MKILAIYYFLLFNPGAQNLVGLTEITAPTLEQCEVDRATIESKLKAKYQKPPFYWISPSCEFKMKREKQSQVVQDEAK